MRGLFITLEGIDGCGKTTQARLLAERLRRAGHAVVLTREPGGTPVAEAISALVKDRANYGAMDALTELFLYMASRAQHVAEVIRPALEAGRVVVCERFSDSTYAYQGYGRGLDRALIGQLDSAATGGLRPDLTILLNVSLHEALKRRAQRAGGPDRLESERENFHRRVLEGYREIAHADPGRVVVVDGAGTSEEVGRRIGEIVGAVVNRQWAVGS